MIPLFLWGDVHVVNDLKKRADGQHIDLRLKNERKKW